MEHFGTGAGDSVAGVGIAFHPGKEKKKWNPAADTLFELRSDDIDDAGEVERQADGDGLQGSRIGTVLRRGAYQVFAADERADGVNGAGLILEEGAGDALVEVLDGQLARGRGFGKPIFVDHAIYESGGGQLEERLMEAAGEFLLAGFREGANPGGEGLGLEDADRHHLAAAGSAAGLAGDAMAGFGQLRADAGDERVVKRLDDRQYLREVGLAGRHDGRGCDPVG